MSDRAALTRIGAVDDHPAILSGIVDGLRVELPSAEVTVVAPTVAALLAEDRAVDIVLLDVVLDDGSDIIENVAALLHRGWPVLLFTQEKRLALIARALRAGASGIVGKHEDLGVLAHAITCVTNGGPYLSTSWASALASLDSTAVPDLTRREAEALRLYAIGLPLKSVARRMGVAIDTAKEYLLRARRKYADAGRPALTKTDLYVRAVEDGHLAPPTGPGAS